jgi:PleD family two-component response regulator
VDHVLTVHGVRPDMDAKTVFEQADNALYRAKNRGRNNVQIFENIESMQISKGVN